MTVPTNISEPPMAHTEQNSLHRSKGKKHPIPMELNHQVFDTVVGIFENDQLEDDLHEQYHHNPESIKQECDYKLNEVQKHLNPNIIQKITLFTYWMTKERECGMSALKDDFN